MKKLVVFSGAGISAESGIPTFRDGDGLWERHKIEDVATPDGWRRNKELVLEFYNERRRNVKEVQPNDGHKAIVEFEKEFDVTVVTQNIDDLHERSGSSNVIHLHGEILKSRSSLDPSLKFDCDGDIKLGDKCPKGSQLRPDVVWFGEPVPMMDVAQEIVQEADVLIVVGTSLAVWPAAGIPYLAKDGCKIFYVNPKVDGSFPEDVYVVREVASKGMKTVAEFLSTGEIPVPEFEVTAVLDVVPFGKYVAAAQTNKVEYKDRCGKKCTLNGVPIDKIDRERLTAVLFHLVDEKDAAKFKKGDVVKLEQK